MKIVGKNKEGCETCKRIAKWISDGSEILDSLDSSNSHRESAHGLYIALTTYGSSFFRLTNEGPGDHDENVHNT